LRLFGNFGRQIVRGFKRRKLAVLYKGKENFLTYQLRQCCLFLFSLVSCITNKITHFIRSDGKPGGYNRGIKKRRILREEGAVLEDKQE